MFSCVPSAYWTAQMAMFVILRCENDDKTD